MHNVCIERHESLHSSLHSRYPLSKTGGLRWSSLPAVQLWQLGAQEHVLLIVQHHSITDGLSLSVLSHDLAAAYSLALRESSPQWSLPPVSYIDYAVWQRQHCDGAALEVKPLRVYLLCPALFALMLQASMSMSMLSTSLTQAPTQSTRLRNQW